MNCRTRASANPSDGPIAPTKPKMSRAVGRTHKSDERSHRRSDVSSGIVRLRHTKVNEREPISRPWPTTSGSQSNKVASSSLASSASRLDPNIVLGGAEKTVSRCRLCGHAISHHAICLDLARPGAPPKWRYDPDPLGTARGDTVNGGPAFSNHRLFVNRLDAYSVADEASSGRQL
jgi:hypothetical protein